MKQALRLPALAPALLAFAASSAAHAVPGGEIGTLTKGRYVCELPGDALGPAGVRVPEADFEIVSASSYVTSDGRGTYLLTGEYAVMTSGPMNGQRFHRVSSGFLRLMDKSGKDEAMRCVLAFRAES